MNEFPHTVTLQKETKVSDGMGGSTLTWEPLKDVEAHVMPISGDTFFIAQQNQSKITFKVFMEFDEEITSSLRVIHKEEEILNIKAVLDQGGLGEILCLMCESGGILK